MDSMVKFGTISGYEWWDRGAPYGPNGYSFGRGEFLTDEVRRAVLFELTDRSPVISHRGVAEMADGSLYLLAIRREGAEAVMAGVERRYLADRTQFHNSFAGLVGAVADYEHRLGFLADEAHAKLRRVDGVTGGE